VKTETTVNTFKLVQSYSTANLKKTQTNKKIHPKMYSKSGGLLDQNSTNKSWVLEQIW